MSARSALIPGDCVGCGGSGYVPSLKYDDVPCPDCHATGKMPTRLFPVMLTHTRARRERLLALGCPMTVPWDLLLPHEEQAKRNHGGQSLQRLAERGGLDPRELLAVLRDERWALVAELTDEEVVDGILRAHSAWIERLAVFSELVTDEKKESKR